MKLIRQLTIDKQLFTTIIGMHNIQHNTFIYDDEVNNLLNGRNYVTLELAFEDPKRRCRLDGVR